MKGVSGVFRLAISAIGRDQIRAKGGAVSPIKGVCLHGLGLPGFLNLILFINETKRNMDLDCKRGKI